MKKILSECTENTKGTFISAYVEAGKVIIVFVCLDIPTSTWRQDDVVLKSVRRNLTLCCYDLTLCRRIDGDAT